MKKILVIGIVFALLTGSCGKTSNGELTGVPGRPSYTEPDPYGMVFIPQGSFTMGPTDQDASWAQNNAAKTVSLEPFWMDDTEITNNEYRQFVYWVRDSLVRRKLGEQDPDTYLITEDENNNPIDPPAINWGAKIDTRDPDVEQSLEDFYLKKEERFFGRKEFDTRKLKYEYFWVDLQQAAKKSNRYQFDKQRYEGLVTNSDGEQVTIKDRSSFILNDNVYVYPDTLCWVADFTYSYNEPMTNLYFWHPGYDNYPVVGVNWKQATAFCIWRTQLLNSFLSRYGEPSVQDYQLPTEAQWEYAARGGLAHAMYPWGGVYTTNKSGCYLANFKPLRGNYAADGGIKVLKVASYEPNEWGLYDMAGNVAEWCSSAFDESSGFFTHDLDPDYKYNAHKNDQAAMKRKVVKGGSWKDIAYYLQAGTRTYEYQDTARSYIGFRCIRPYVGNYTK
ncbi:MAG: SUMF1/EgtB/PvdO family nonheme iron enzyme [Bacteroidota bacterium]|nr:SUMF1/EgtB/PvdO family nonheme iron enzyme [Bacteroidota bacterium]